MGKISGLPNITRIRLIIQKFKTMRQSYFIEYVPNSYMNLCTDKAQQRANNQFIYDFKNGNRAASRICGKLLMKYLSNRYGNLLSDFVVVFAPCSSQAKYNKRFGYVAAMLKAMNVILFDDLLTSGKTIEEFKEKIEAAGAYVEEEIFLGRTIHHDPISMRGCLQEMAEGFYDSVARSKRCFPQGVQINKSNRKIA